MSLIDSEVEHNSRCLIGLFSCNSKLKLGSTKRNIQISCLSAVGYNLTPLYGSVAHAYRPRTNTGLGVTFGTQRLLFTIHTFSNVKQKARLWDVVSNYTLKSFCTQNFLWIFIAEPHWA